MCIDYYVLVYMKEGFHPTVGTEIGSNVSMVSALMGMHTLPVSGWMEKDSCNRCFSCSVTSSSNLGWHMTICILCRSFGKLSVIYGLHNCAKEHIGIISCI